MLKFRPIVYKAEDLRAFKYTGTSAILEGAACRIAASSNRHVMCATPIKSAAGTLPATGATLYRLGEAFLIYRNDPDIENVGATISQNDYVVGFTLAKGNEFEVHKTAVANASFKPFQTFGRNVSIATSGYLCSVSHSKSTGLVIGQVIGTFNDTWLRVRCI